MNNIKFEFAFDNAITLGEKALQNGKIILSDSQSHVSYLATSGLAGYQSSEGSRVKGRGRIPSCKQAKIEHYNITTTPIYLPRTSGIKGFFYPITPFVVSVDGYSRGDFGLHFDAVPGTPGSAGCVVVRLLDHWRKLQGAILLLKDKGVKTIPLYVS